MWQAPEQRDPLVLGLAPRIAEAYAWHRALGNRTIESRWGRFVVDPENPNVWDANCVQHPRAATTSEIDALLALMEETFAHCRHRMVMTDGHTPDSIVARLLADGFAELDATIQMALGGELAAVYAPALDFTPVDDEPAWRSYRLMRADHQERRGTRTIDIPDEVTRGLMRIMRRKAGPVTFYLASLSGEAVAYASKVECPNGLGMIEDVFTLPTARNRGIASALMRNIVDRLRAEIPDRPVFLGAHARDNAKRLYRRLGFQPVMVTRDLVRQN